MLTWKGCSWPLDQDACRLKAYCKYEEIFEGAHREAFRPRKYVTSNGKTVYLGVNVAGVISRVTADFLFGEAPSFRVGDTGTPEQQALDALVESNDLATTFYEAALSASFRGDAVFRVRVGPRRAGARTDVIIEEIPAYSYHAERSPDNARQVLSEAVVWPRKVGRLTYLRVETHVPGHIVHQAFRYNPDTQVIGDEVSLDEAYPDGDAPPPEEDTGVEDSLLVHVPNFRHGSLYYGISDYEGLVDLFEAVNNRLTQIDRILDRHASPKLVGLPGMSDPRGLVDVEALEYIEADSELFKTIPRYVTWDANLTQAFADYETLLLTCCRMAEISPSALGMDDNGGGSANSGVALRLRYLSTEHKCNRKKRYFDRGIKKLLRIALALGAVKLGMPAVDQEPEIIWQDGLPQIYPEAVQTEALRVSSGLSSKVSAIQRLDGCTAEQAEAELERILLEAKADCVDANARPVRPVPTRLARSGRAYMLKEASIFIAYPLRGRPTGVAPPRRAPPGPSGLDPPPTSSVPCNDGH